MKAVPDNIAHLYLAGMLAAELGVNVNLSKRAALLHDLGKTPCLGTLNNHAELGAGILEGLGYPHVAQVVREHVHLDGNILDPPNSHHAQRTDIHQGLQIWRAAQQPQQ